MKYSSVKASVFGEAHQQVQGLKDMNLLKTATAWWLSHGEASVQITSRFEPLTTSLDETIRHRNDPELHGTTLMKKLTDIN